MAPPKTKQSKLKAAAVNSTSTSTTSTTSTNFLAEFYTSIEKSVDSYFQTLTPKLKLIDIFLSFLVIVALIQFVFAILVGNFPFNAFLGGFISTVGQFVLTVSLRLQSVPQNQESFKKISPERYVFSNHLINKLLTFFSALGDYIFASLILHFIIYHFIN